MSEPPPSSVAASPATAGAVAVTVASAPPPADPPPAATPPPAAHAAPAPATAPQIEGTLKVRKGKEVMLHLDGPELPPAGVKATLSKYFEGKPGEVNPLGILGSLFGGTITGWVVIADVTVKRVNGKDVTVTIDAEQSRLAVNGKPVDQFTPGAKVKLASTSGQ
jgi:hypothetical protein